MQVKIKALLHITAVCMMFFLTDAFCHEVIRMAVLRCSSMTYITVLYTCLDILNVWIAVFLYAKYVLRMAFSEIYLGKPFPGFRWCAVGLAIPCVIDIIYFLFTKGGFAMGYHTQDDLAYILFHEVFSSGIRIAVTEGILFRGLLSSILQNEFGRKWGIFASSFFYAAASFLFYDSFAPIEPADLGGFLLTFLMSLAFTSITCETGSVWSSVAIHFLYNALSGDAYILHIDTGQDHPAIFTYTVESGHLFFTELPVPSMAVFLVLIILTIKITGKRDEEQL